MLLSGSGGRCSVRSSRASRSSSQTVCHRHGSLAVGRRVVPLLPVLKQHRVVCAAAAAPDTPDSSNISQRTQHPAEVSAHAAAAALQEGQLLPDQDAQQQQQQQGESQQPSKQRQQQAPGRATSSSNKSNPYDNTRWWVRSSDWKKGAPPMEQRPMDFLVVGPNNAPHRHASYLTKKLLTGKKGRMMVLFHGSKGAAKVLSTLHLATHQLQRKYQTTLLCQVGPAEQDALKLKLIARLWPYAGTWQPPLSGASSSTGAAGPAAASSTAGAAAAGLRRRCSWLQRGLQGTIPDPQQLPYSVQRLPSFALPVVISQRCTFRSCRTTDPRVLAQQIATAMTQKGRARVLTAGGLAALHALQAVRLADVILARAWQRGLIMHVECVAEKQPISLLGQIPAQPAWVSAPAAAAAAAGGGGGGSDLGSDSTAAAAAAAAGPDLGGDSAAAADLGGGEDEVVWDGEQYDEELGGYINQDEWDDSSAAGMTNPVLLDPVKKRQQVKYYVLTLIAAHRDWDATPSTSMFPARRVDFVPQQQQQQQQRGSSQQQQQQQGRSGV